jgi:D-beta-D-heptose 7-phosphate kinase/D-beta-D-heptose 1-phosphate adenosyltransferase
VDFKELESLKNVNILVIGDLMLDTYQIGTSTRISPEAPVPVVNLKDEKHMLGGAGNVLKNLVSFGVKCEIMSVVGKDETGKKVLELVDQLNINASNIYEDVTRKTTLKKRVLVSGQQLLRIDTEDNFAISKGIENHFLNHLKLHISTFDIIVLSDYAKGVLTYRLCEEIIAIANVNGVKTIVDPKDRDFKKFSNAYLFKPNKKEAISMLETEYGEIESVCKELKKTLNAENIVMTLAEDGIAYLSEEFKIIPTISSQIYDVSGAGDTVLASLAICCAKKIPLEKSCVFANAAASIVIQQVGSCVTTIDLVLKQIKNEFRFN